MRLFATKFPAELPICLQHMYQHDFVGAEDAAAAGDVKGARSLVILTSLRHRDLMLKP